MRELLSPELESLATNSRGRWISRARVSTFPIPGFRGFIPALTPEPPAVDTVQFERHDRIFAAPQTFTLDRTDDRNEIRRLFVWFQAGGDEDEFFRRLMAIFRPRLRGLFARKGWKPEDCEDLIQDTFLGVVKGLGSLRNDNALTSWIFVIARNKEREKRKAHRFPAKPSPDDSKEVDVVDENPSPEDFARAREELRRVNSRILKFPPMRRSIFLFKYFRGRENTEIAALLGCTEVTVRVQLHLARKQLRGFFGSNAKGDEE